jgi:hypothetical protein
LSEEISAGDDLSEVCNFIFDYLESWITLERRIHGRDRLRVPVDRDQPPRGAQPGQYFAAVPSAAKRAIYVTTVRLNVETFHHRAHKDWRVAMLALVVGVHSTRC